jgi:hypothetical protein
MFSQHITSNEAGKVMISLTNKAGGVLTPATASNVDSAVLHKACVENGTPNPPSDATLGNIFLGCQIL